MATAITALNRSQIPAAANVLACAFADDPVMVHTWESTSRSRKQRLLTYFTATLTHHHYPGGGVDVALDGTHVVGVAVWNPPGLWKPGFTTTIKQTPAALWSLRSRIPAALAVRHEFDDVHPVKPHWYLCHLATDPQRRNAGIGTQLLTYRLAITDQRNDPAYLVCTRTETRALYRSAGFLESGSLSLASGPQLWPMWRQARPETSSTE